jgi:hypothetical protein
MMSVNSGDAITLSNTIFKSATVNIGDTVRIGADYIRKSCPSLSVGDSILVDSLGIKKSYCCQQLNAFGTNAFLEVSHCPSESTGYELTVGDYWAVVALKSDGSLKAWGNDNGIGVIANLPTGGGYVAIKTGYNNYVWIGHKNDGSITAWGYDVNGVIANCPADTGITYIWYDYLTAVIVKSDTSLHAWGLNDYNQVTNCPADTGYVSVCGNYYTMVALKSDGSLKAWGSNVDNQVTNCPTGTGFVSVCSGDYLYAFCALKDDGTLHAWGRAGTIYGCPIGTGFVAVYSGYYCFVALKDDGTLHAWGSYAPIVSGCPTDDGYIGVSSIRDNYTMVALKDDGTIKAWGRDTDNQVTNCPTDDGYIGVYGYYNTFFGLKSDGTIKAWGDDSMNQVSKCPKGKGFVDIFPGQYVTVAKRNC